MTNRKQDSDPQFTLASASPRRRALLQQIGLRFRVRPVDVDETPLPGEAPEPYVLRLAARKARRGAALWPGLPAMGADTTVVLGGKLLGKPADEDEAVACLMALSGRKHRVLSAVALVRGERLETRLSTTVVGFRRLMESECRAYWRTGEPADKAGGYAIQGLGAVFVTAIEGSYSGVVGLPLAETGDLLRSFGISYWQQPAPTGV